MQELIGYQFNGLCNRLFTLLNTEYLAQKFGVVSRAFIWPTTPRCHCNFNDILVNNSDTSIYNDCGYILDRIVDSGQKAVGVIRGNIVNYDGVALCNAPHPLCDDVVKFFSSFAWSDEVKRLVPPYSFHKIRGVHIRSTDGTSSIVRPLDSYLAVIDKGEHVFLATDSFEIQKQFTEQRPNTIVLNTPQKSPDQSLAIKYAAAELICLSMCKEIVGSPSSFSRFASMYGRTPLRQV